MASALERKPIETQEFPSSPPQKCPQTQAFPAQFADRRWGPQRFFESRTRKEREAAPAAKRRRRRRRAATAATTERGEIKTQNLVPFSARALPRLRHPLPPRPRARRARRRRGRRGSRRRSRNRTSSRENGNSSSCSSSSSSSGAAAGLAQQQQQQQEDENQQLRPLQGRRPPLHHPPTVLRLPRMEQRFNHFADGSGAWGDETLGIDGASGAQAWQARGVSGIGDPFRGASGGAAGE